MPTVSRQLPIRPHLDVPKREARQLLDGWRRGDPEALNRIRQRHPKCHDAHSTTNVAFRLADAQLVIAREYGMSSWTALKRRVHAHAIAVQLDEAIRAGDREAVVAVLRQHPHLLDLPVWSGNWGPPMSHAANLGRLEIVQAVAALGARDHQHAFDRALLQGQIECARWLYERGARLAPGIVMGACETLNAAGLGFLADLKAPFTDDKGRRLAPLAMVLETYARNPEGKRKILDILERQGYELPDTPVLAFHRGDVARLSAHLRRDPGLIARRFGARELYPPDLGCAEDGRSGLHGTPLEGTTLLHMAIDYDEREIFDLLLACGADVNARAAIDAEGFGGHTPLFNAVVSCARANGRQRDAVMTRRLLARGAVPGVRTTMRKFLDWREEPGWHLARDVTPVEWASTFPERGWVNTEAVQVLGAV